MWDDGETVSCIKIISGMRCGFGHEGPTEAKCCSRELGPGRLEKGKALVVESLQGFGP